MVVKVRAFVNKCRSTFTPWMVGLLCGWPQNYANNKFSNIRLFCIRPPPPAEAHPHFHGRVIVAQPRWWWDGQSVLGQTLRTLSGTGIWHGQALQARQVDNVLGMLSNIELSRSYPNWPGSLIHRICRRRRRSPQLERTLCWSQSHAVHGRSPFHFNESLYSLLPMAKMFRSFLWSR